jgi:hypothetical protein
MGLVERIERELSALLVEYSRNRLTDPDALTKAAMRLAVIALEHLEE